MTKAFIKVRTNYEFFHCWKDAPEEVSFLRNLHRHIFYVIAKVEVVFLDREIEFFMFKKELDSLISELKSKWVASISCEQMATDILNELKKKYKKNNISIEVSEDNENSAIVEEKV